VANHQIDDFTLNIDMDFGYLYRAGFSIAPENGIFQKRKTDYPKPTDTTYERRCPTFLQHGTLS
jgi:hypothetical protein